MKKQKISQKKNNGKNLKKNNGNNLKRKKNKIPKILFSILIIIGILICILMTPIFDVKQISVKGNEQISTPQIISLSQIKNGENIIKYKKNQIVKNIKENPYIKTVNIKKKYPNSIEISVTERNVRLMIQLLSSYAYTDSQGYILEISQEKKDVPILKGIATNENDILPGKRLEIKDLEKLGDVLKILEAVNEINIQSNITYIDISDDNNYIIYIEKEKKTIYLGDVKNLNNKMLYLKKILEKEAEYEGEIFLNGNLNEGFNPYFREKV